MTLRHLKIFVAVCECGSITEAARTLYLAQPAVSAAVRELERYYGVKLFDRISHKLYLTSPGGKVLDYARHITALFTELDQGMRDSEHTGEIRVGSSITIGTCLLPRLAGMFRRELPEIRLKARVVSSETIEQMVLTNEVDLGLIEGEAHSSLLEAEPFLEDCLVTVCAPDSPLAKKERLTLAELAAQPLLLREKGSGTRELLDGVLVSHGLSVEPLWESNSTNALVRAVQAGLGVSVLSGQLIKEQLENGRLCAVSLEETDLLRRFLMITHRHKYLSPGMKRFMTLCRGLDAKAAGRLPNA